MTKHRAKRSLNANALFWKMCDGLAVELRLSSEEMYVTLLDRYGYAVYLQATLDAADAVKACFRLAEEIGFAWVDQDGEVKEGVSLRCVIGSSQYNTKQMARLIDGTVGECEQVGCWYPDKDQIESGLRAWEAQFEKQKSKSV